MPGSEVRTENDAGNRRPSEATRAKLRETGRARWAAMTPEQQEAQRARLRRGSPSATPAPSTSSSEPPPVAGTGGPRSPLADALGAPEKPARQVAPGTNGHDRASGPPIFRVPDLPALEPAGDPLPGLEGDPAGPELGGVQVSQAQVETLLRFPFELVALRRGDHWKLRPDELAMIAEPLTRKINEHAIAARALGAGGDVVVIAGGLVVVISARVMEDSRLASERAARDGSSPGRLPDRDAGRGHDRAAVADARRAGGTLNGFNRPGALDAGSAPAVDAEAAGHPLSQAL